jgi:hypothetical protein
MLILLLAFLMPAADAIILNPIPPTHLKLVRENPDPPTCEELEARLIKFSENARAEDNALFGFMTDVSSINLSWYQELQPLENTTQTISVGTFKDIYSGVNEINNVMTDVSSNSSVLAGEMDLILQAVHNCLKPRSLNGNHSGNRSGHARKKRR